MSCTVCIPYVFDDSFLDWEELVDSQGDSHYLIGFGNTAAGPFPASSGQDLSLIFNPGFSGVSFQESSCGCSVGYVFTSVEGPDPLGWMSLPLLS